jgi:hypothetical protein
MKTTVGQLKNLINEEYLKGVPEFLLQQATEKYVAELRQHIKRYILVHKSESTADQREALAAADKVLYDLEEKTNKLMEDALFEWLRQI